MNLFRVAAQGVTGYPIRSLLTVLSLVAGVVGVVSVYAASSTIQSTVTQRALLTGGPISTIDFSGPKGLTGLAQAKFYERQLREYYGASSQSALIVDGSDAALLYGSRYRIANIMISTSELRSIRGYPVVRGSWFGASQSQLHPRAVVNEALYESLTRGVAALRLRLGSRTSPLSVIGVIKDGSTDPTAYLNVDDVKPFFDGTSDTVYGFELTSPDATQQTAMIRLNFVSSLRGDSIDWSAERRDTVGQFVEQIDTTRSSFLTVGVLGIVASGIGVLNVGLSALRQRSSELALRRALGARRWHLPAIMIIESQINAVIAGVVAVPVSILTYTGIANTFGAPFGVSSPQYPWQYALVGVGFGMAAALVAGLIPGILATRLKMTIVMRE